MRKYFSFFIIALILFFSDPSGVIAETLEISGNGSSSNSSVVVNSGSIITVLQTNKADIETIIDAKSNTGRNTLDSGTGGSIVTGDATTIVKVNNVVNQNSTVVACCVTPTAVPTSSPKPSPTPTTLPTSPNNSNPSSKSSSSSSDPIGIGGSPVILGLSNTASESDLATSLRLVVGIVCVFTSLGVLRTVRPV